MSSPTQPNARLVIIGNEVLSGKVEDANTPFLLRRLRQLGVRCDGVVVVPDEEHVIAEAVRSASERADWVLTTGGVGPTHDDVTMKSIALAFELPIEENPEVAAFLRSHGRHGGSPERLRMALLPQGAHVDFGGPFPQVRVRNVWIFPGVPRLLQSKFELIAPQLGGVPMYCSGLYSHLRESEIALRLEDIVREHPNVEVGSYPQWLETGYRVLITLESLTQEAVSCALAQLIQSLDASEVIEIVESFHPENEPS